MLLLLSFLLTVSYAQQPLLQQFRANLTITYGGTQGIPGTIAFDYAAKGGSIFVPALQMGLVGTPSTDQSTAAYALLQGICQSLGDLVWSTLPPTFFLPPPPICASNGAAVVNGKPCNAFSCTTPGGDNVAVYLSVADNTFVRVNGTVDGPFAVDFSNTVIGPVPPSSYTKPADCK